jgi:DNA-binding NarL/FixJ family response regulator
MPFTILIAEDDLGTRLSISDYLELLGHTVIATENGWEALRQLEKVHPHLLITDVMMPQLDGYELVRRIRQQPLWRLLPVIFLTAKASTPERIQGYQLGCDIYLAKPFELEELGAVVRNLLERSHLMQSEWRVHIQSFQTAVSSEDQYRSAAIANVENLTRREQEVLGLLAEGLSNNQIGEQLHLSSRTVEKYVSSLLRKTTTNNRAELIRFAVRHHLVQ